MEDGGTLEHWASIGITLFERLVSLQISIIPDIVVLMLGQRRRRCDTSCISGHVYI